MGKNIKSIVKNLLERPTYFEELVKASNDLDVINLQQWIDRLTRQQVEELTEAFDDPDKYPKRTEHLLAIAMQITLLENPTREQSFAEKELLDLYHSLGVNLCLEANVRDGKMKMTGKYTMAGDEAKFKITPYGMESVKELLTAPKDTPNE